MDRPTPGTDPEAGSRHDPRARHATAATADERRPELAAAVAPLATRYAWQIPELDRVGGYAPLDDLGGRLCERLGTPVSGATLDERLAPPVLLIVPDATRASGVRAMVTAVREAFDRAGVPAAARHLLVAGGTHRPPTAAEVQALAGESGDYASIHLHDARDAAAMIDMRPTSRRTPVSINRQLWQCRSLVLVGGITGHYFAGFTGGWKGIVPAAAGYATVLANHRLAVDPGSPTGLHPACREANLAGNPVHADLVEAARQVPPPFLINVIIGAAGKPVEVVCGDVEAAHAEGVRIAGAACRPPVAAADLVVIGAADAGRERDWIQAHKVLRQGAAWLRDGGVLVARLRCPDGLGSESLAGWFDVPVAELAGRVAEHYTLHGHTALAMRALEARVRVILVSELPDALVRRLGMEPAQDIASALATAAGAVPPGASALLLARAGALLPPV